MSDKIMFSISIPSDEDGYVLQQCGQCGEYFMCTPTDIQSDEVLNLFCPSCGLISESYITDDVIQLANAMVKNYMNDYLHDILKEVGRKCSSKNIKVTAGQKSKPEYENPIHSSVNDFTIKKFDCCNRSAKINRLLAMSASFCPFCGVISFANE